MRLLFGVLVASAGIFSVGAASAQSTITTGYGSAVYDTKRLCPADASVACDGRAADQGVVQSSRTGGAGQAVTTTYTATGPGAGSNAYSNISFGDLGLPVIKTSAQAIGSVRIGSNNYAYQSYTYTGAADFDLLLNATFHIDNSSTDNADGTKAHGGLAAAYFAIWNKADFFSYADEYFTGTGNFNSTNSLINQGYLFGAYDCNDFAAYADPNDLPHGALATGYGGATLTGGETSINVAQTNCHDQSLTIKQGDEFVIATYTAVFANRDAFVDATGTYTVKLDPAMGQDAIRAFSEGVTYASAAPEPASWAMMVSGFGLAGAALRRRKATVSFA